MAAIISIMPKLKKCQGYNKPRQRKNRCAYCGSDKSTIRIENSEVKHVVGPLPSWRKLTRNHLRAFPRICQWCRTNKTQQILVRY